MQTLEFVIYWLIAVNLVTFVLFGYDRVQAQAGGWRVFEEALMLWVVAGGIFGALAGRKAFRHKTRKPSFTAKMWSVALVNLCFVGSLFAMWTQARDGADFDETPSDAHNPWSVSQTDRTAD